VPREHDLSFISFLRTNDIFCSFPLSSLAERACGKRWQWQIAAAATAHGERTRGSRWRAEEASTHV
jgi:hypothetical protein